MGKNFTLNAAVGNNGIQDHQTYGEGFDLATKLLIRESKKGIVPIDAVIYPLVFCARHRIELFLKDQIMKLTCIRENKNITEEKLVNTHNLNNLWDIYRDNAGKTDWRFQKFINDAEEYILDFAEIDATSETFRYPYDKYKTEKHLINTPIINIAVLEERYNELSQMIEELEYLTEYLIEEYRENTFTSKLSRKDIYDIAINLPEKKNWRSDDFLKIKNETMKKYDISGRKFSEALNIIVSHQEFCAEIGLEIPLSYLDSSSLLTYINLYNDLYKSATFENGQSKHISLYFERLSSCIKELQSKICKETIVCIYTLKELSKLNYFSEAYDRLLDKHLEDAKIDYFYQTMCNSIFGNRNALNFIKNSLIQTGQKTLVIKCFNT
jgi:hypothetical protein